MLQILTIISPVFLIIFSSALLQRFKNIGDNWSVVLNEFALKIGLPVLIFSSLAKTYFSFAEQAPIIFSNSLFIIGGFLLSIIIGKILRFKKQTLRTVVICLMLSNVAYLGIPTLIQIYGADILPTASLIVAIYLFWVFTIGIGYLDITQQRKKKDVLNDMIKNLLTDPLIIAIVLGIVISSFNIKMPSILMISMDMITASVTPTVLIVIGLFIGKSKIGKLKEWIPVFLFSLMTLLILPAIFFLGLKFLGISPRLFSSSILEAAMPLAITPFALSDRFGLNKEFIARSIVLSTILSVISLPFWISILQY